MTSQRKTLSLFLKQQCQFPVQIQCSFLYIDQALPLNSFFKTSIYISCIPWSKVCMILASPLHHFFISLFLVICFKLPTTQTFFYFPRRFEWLGVNCSYIVFIAILFTNDRQKTKGHKSQTRMQWIYTAKQSILVEYSQLLPCKTPCHNGHLDKTDSSYIPSKNKLQTFKWNKLPLLLTLTNEDTTLTSLQCLL